MRVVIAEDEPKTREGLLSIIQRFTDYDVVGVAENGLEGLRLLEEKEPDLIIADIRMPVMDGLEMMEEARKKEIPSQVIYLTGYSEFEYARKALQLQAADYILKPVEIDRFLDCMKVIESRIRRQELQRLKPEQILYSYLAEDEEHRSRLLPLVEEELKVNDRIQCSLFFIHPASIARETYATIRKELQQEIEMLCMENSYIFMRNGERGGLYVLFVDTERHRSLKNLFALRILKPLQEITPCVCTAVTLNGIRALPEAMEQAYSYLPYVFFVPEGQIVDWITVKEMTFEKQDYPISIENEMIQMIRSGKTDKIQETGEDFIRRVLYGKGDAESIRDYSIRFILAILRVVEELYGDRSQRDNEPFMLSQIQNCLTRRELKYYLDRIIQETISVLTAKGEKLTENGLVLNAISYVRENYNRPLSLSEVAQFCNVSPEHLSRLFKEETGVKFVDFLTNFRISMAKRLLVMGGNKVSEISEMVGFSDQKYFQKVFKKVCGVTPMEYKKENTR